MGANSGMTKFYGAMSLFVAGGIGLAISAGAQVPRLINYQGRLLSGTNLVNGNVGLSLRLFNVASGGTAQYEDSNTVTVADGLYSTFIGDNTTAGNLTNALTNATVWIEVAVNGVALSPRERMASVPYALNVNAAGIAGTIADANLSANIARLNSTNQSFSGRVNFNSASNTFTGTFSGNGAGVRNVRLASVTVDQPPIIFGWGDNFEGQTTVPATATGVVAIAAGYVHGLALRADGTVIGWGQNGYGQAAAPATATGVVAVAGGNSFSLVLRADGTVIAWGLNNDGQTAVPATATGVVAIACGFYHSLALRADGAVIAWGDNVNGQATVPALAENVTAIAGGGFFSLALGSARAQLARLDVATNIFAGTVQAAAFTGDGSALSGVTAAALAGGIVSNDSLSLDVQMNISARLASNVWAAADATTNYTRRNGGTMTGVLSLPAGGLAVGTFQLVVSASGNVGIGTNAPAAKLDVAGYVDAQGYAGRSGIGGTYNGHKFNFDWQNNSALHAYVDYADLGTITFTSDRRLKEDIAPMANDSLARVMALKPSTFKYRNIPGTIFTSDGDTKEGFIADELQQVIHSAVNGTTNAVTSDGTIQPQTVNTLPIVSVLTKAMQEQQQHIEALEQIILDLRARMDALERK